MTLAYSLLLEMLKAGTIQVEDQSLGKACLQPASFDLPLTTEIYRMPSSALPQPGQTVREMVKERALYTVPVENPLELGIYYLIRTPVRLSLPPTISGSCNNKSSSGRLNLQGRMVLDGVSAYDTIPHGYEGEVWVELHPDLVPIQIQPFCPANAVTQIRLREGNHTFSKEEVCRYHSQKPLLYLPDGSPVKTENLQFGLDQRNLLVGVSLESPVGWEGIRRNDTSLALTQRDTNPKGYFRTLFAQNDSIILNKDHFYILGSYQRVSNPLDVCITMSPFQAEHGEFRSHFAGFFDPGNGYGRAGEQKGFCVTMEVIPMEDSIEIKHQQPMFSICIEPLMGETKVYGIDYPSNYFCTAGPKLSKHFKAA